MRQAESLKQAKAQAEQQAKDYERQLKECNDELDQAIKGSLDQS